jgi:MFS family permease
MRTNQFWLTLIWLFFFAYCYLTLIVHIVPHAIDMGIPAHTAASVLATFGIVSILGKVILGVAGDRIGSRQVLHIGFVLMTISSYLLVSADDMAMLYVLAAVYGFAYGGIATAESPLVAALFGVRSHGLIYGMLLLGYTVGSAVGPFIAGYVFDLTGSYRLAFLICGIMSSLAFVLTALLKPVRGMARRI